MMQRYLRQLTQLSIINFIFIVALFFFIQKNTTTPAPQKNPVRQEKNSSSSSSLVSPTIIIVAVSPTQSVKKNLISELSAHNIKSNCWLAVGGRVYDVTTYFGSHPGGDDVIEKYCGQDATGPFQSKDGIGTDHSASAYDLLRQYLIQ